MERSYTFAMAKPELPTDEHAESLYGKAISRRSLLIGGAALGAVFAVPALACGGKSDKSTFDAGSQSTTTAASRVTSTTTKASTSGGTPIPANGQVVIDFTYGPTGGGVAKNPYIAVWVETITGEFVDTVSLWYQSGKGDRYLSDMRAWVSSSGGTDKSMSSATRAAGSYSVVWEGTNSSGQKVAQGDYMIFIECARERGPYEVISQPMSILAAPTSASPAGKGEISAVTMKYTP